MLYDVIISTAENDIWLQMHFCISLVSDRDIRLEFEFNRCTLLKCWRPLIDENSYVTKLDYSSWLQYVKVIYHPVRERRKFSNIGKRRQANSQYQINEQASALLVQCAAAAL